MKKTKILIGSAAVDKHAPGLVRRDVKDMDYLTTDSKSTMRDNEDFIDGSGILDKYSFTSDVASLDELYTLKVSHSFWVVSSVRTWQKHMSDIRLLKDYGASLVPELYDVCYAVWEQRKGAKNVNLSQDREEFFGNNVRRKYVHDSVHAAVAYHDEPMYTRILADGEEVKTSKRKFFELSDAEKRDLVREEVMVLSLERDLVPLTKDIDDMDILTSYTNQLRLLITQYSKGYFPLWIVENYYTVLQPSHNYWKTFEKSDKKTLL